MKHHISTKLLLSFILLIVLCITLFGIIIYSFTFNALLNKSIQTSRAITSKLSASIDDEIKEIDNISKVFVTTNETIDLLQSKEDMAENHSNYSNLDLYTKIFFILKPNAESTLITDMNGHTYSFGYNNYIPAGYNVKEESWFNDFWNSDELYTIIPPFANPGHFNYQIMAVVRKIRLPYTKKNIGLMKIDFKLDPLIGIINSSLPTSTDINVLDQENRLIYTTFTNSQLSFDNNIDTFTKEQGYFKTIINDDTYYVTYEKSPYSHLTYALYIPQKELLVHLPELIRDMLATAFLCLLVGFFISFIISKPFVNSIKNLAEGMNQIEKGNINYRVQKTTEDEIGYLTTQFNTMAKNIQNLIHINAEIKSKSIIQEMKVLQSQITPHFLFNSLESIRMKALSNKPEAVSYIVEELGELLRFNLRTPNDLIPLKKEFFYIQKYINIHNAGIHQRIQIYFPDLEGYESLLIPKFILQPLIENAINHGLEPKNTERAIIIDLTQDEQTIWLSVEDNGIGISENKVEALNHAFEKNLSDYHQHIGLTNINNRLKLYYGQQSGLSIASFEGQGTTVLLKLVVKQKPA